MDAMLDGGFADPVFDSQAAFRAILDALANPGTAPKLMLPRLTEGVMGPELVSVLLTLSDHDTPIWLTPRLRKAKALQPFVSFHTGATIVAEPQDAAFAFAEAESELPPLSAFNQGTEEYPDRSTTIVLRVTALEGGASLRLGGPGIKGHCHISPVGLPVDFLGQWQENGASFPRGVDLLLVADGRVTGLPRTTRIEGEH